MFGLLILRTKFGFEAFKGAGNQVTAFLDYTSVGAAFVFGEGYREHFFAFQVYINVLYCRRHSAVSDNCLLMVSLLVKPLPPRHYLGANFLIY